MSEISDSNDSSATVATRGSMVPAMAGTPFEQLDGFGRTENGFSTQAVFTILNRHKALVLGCVGGVTLASAVVALSLPKSYVAEALLILDTRRAEIVQQPPVLTNLVSGSTADTAIVRSEVALLSSPAFARKIIERLDLLHNPVFIRENAPSWFGSWVKRGLATLEGSVGQLFGRQAPAEQPSEEMGRAIASLSRHLVVYSDDRSYTIALKYESQSPEFSAVIVNNLAQLYRGDYLDVISEAARKATIWLTKKVSMLENRVQTDERKVVAFEQENHIETVLSGNVTEQRLHQLNMDLLASTSELTRRQAELTQAEEMAKSAGGADGSAQVLSSPVIQKLREQEADSAARIAPLKETYGLAYPGGDPRTREIRQRISAEIKRIVAGLGGEVRAGRERQAALEESIRQEQSKLDTINSARVQLVQLQHAAAASRSQYDAFLARSQQIEADSQSVQTGIRIVPAEAPVTPAFPNTALFIGFGLFGSLFAGVLLAFLAEQFDESIRDREDAARLTGLPTLGNVPRVKNPGQALVGLVDPRSSAFSEAIYSLLISLGIGNWRGSKKVVAISSAVPDEGKTFIAVALARAAALRGVRTLVIDCDLRRPAVGGLLSDAPRSSALESMFNEKATDFSRFVSIDKLSGLHYLAAQQMMRNPHDILGSLWMSEVVAKARLEYDLVVLDTPPLLAVSDALLIANVVDTVLLAVRWSHTPGKAVSDAAKMLQRHGQGSLSAVLSIVDSRKSSSYRPGNYGYSSLRHARMAVVSATERSVVN